MTMDSAGFGWHPRPAAGFRLLALVIVLFAPSYAAAQNVHREVLDNGGVLVVREVRLTHASAIHVLVRAAPAYEGEQLGSGVSLVLKELLAARLRTALVHVPGHPLRAETRVGATSFTITTSDVHLAEALQVVGAGLADTTWSEEAFELARQRVLRRIDAAAGQPHTLLNRELFRIHPARLPVSGIRAQVASLTADAVRAWQQTAYTAPNTTVVVVGNVPVSRVRRAVADAVQPLPVNGWVARGSARAAPTRRAFGCNRGCG